MTWVFDSFNQSQLGELKESPFHVRDAAQPLLMPIVILNESEDTYYFPGQTQQDRWDEDLAEWRFQHRRAMIRGYDVHGRLIWLFSGTQTRRQIAPVGADPTLGRQIIITVYDTHTVPTAQFIDTVKQDVRRSWLLGISTSVDRSGSMTRSVQEAADDAILALRAWLESNGVAVRYYAEEIEGERPNERWVRRVAEGLRNLIDVAL